MNFCFTRRARLPIVVDVTTIHEDVMTSTPVLTSPSPAMPRYPVPAAVDWHLGSLMIWHLLGDESGGLISLGEVVVRAGGEPPLHIHAREDEAWFVLEGEILFQRGHERITAPPGAAVLLPRGIPHGFAVTSGVARILHMYTPAGIERAFREVSTPAPRRELPPAAAALPDAEAQRVIADAFESRGVTFVGPPLPVILAAEATREAEGPSC